MIQKSSVAVPEARSFNEVELWSRLIEQPGRPLSRATARALLELDFPPSDRDRMNALAAKARAGTITPEEMEEIETYGRVGSVLGILQSKARRALKAAKARNVREC